METVKLEVSTIGIDDNTPLLLYVVQTNPLLIDMVLRKLFCFVDYGTLKECRLVCSQWKELSDYLFIRRSTLVISKSTIEISKSFLESPVDINSLFGSIDFEENKVGFSSFKFELQILTWPVKRTYLVDNKLIMTKLEITGERISDSGPFVNHDADNLIGPNLKTLKLGSYRGAWLVSLEKLSSISEIELHNCIILVDPGVKMAPKVLRLVHCDLRHRGQPGTIPQMKDAVHFEFLLKLYLHILPIYHGRTSLPILNLRDCANIKSLTIICMKIILNGIISAEELVLRDNIYELNEVEVPNFPLNDYVNATHFRKLKMRDNAINFQFGDSLKVEELQIEHRSMLEWKVGANIRKLILNFNDSKDIIDLSLIPKTVEYLELINNTNGNNIFTFSQPANFPNLQQLVLRRCLNNVIHFRDCPKLVDVALHNFGCQDVRNINSEHLPQNIRILSLRDIFVDQIKIQRELKLVAFVLSYPCDQFNHMISYLESQQSQKFQPGLAVFRGYGKGKHSPELSFFRDKLDVPKLFQMRQGAGNCIACGPIYWDSEEIFKASPLFPVVDKMSEYYIFESGRGKGINKQKFYNLIPFIIS